MADDNGPDSQHYRWPDIRTPVLAPDGRRVHRFRTSSLKTLDICAERTRFVMTGEMPDQPTDSTSMGHGLHKQAEQSIDHYLDFGTWLSLADSIAVAQDEFTWWTQQPGFKWVKTKEGGARAYIELAVTAWYQEVRPTLNPIATEVRFGPLVIHEDEERVIQLVGSIDYVDAAGLMDWKTSLGKRWEAWEHERWDIQPTSYLLAAVQSGLLPEADRHPFTFVVFERTRVSKVTVRRIPVYRHAGDFAWFKERCLDTAKFIEANLPVWAKNDNHALCSPTYCPAWDLCKGKHYAKGWPKPSEPARTD